jgi:hypothetical protein
MIKDPDTFIQWTRIDEPGDNPKWESQCGLVEQLSFGDTPKFIGYVGGYGDKPRKPTRVMTTLIATKNEVERIFKKNHPLLWAYQD